MTHALAIADVGALVGDGSRAAMLVALMEGRALSAGELSQCAGITPAATSTHLSKLLRGGLLAVERQGRHRYYRLASDRVGDALEALGLIATASPGPKHRPLSARQAALRHARTCYDHLAGSLGVRLREALQDGGMIVTGDARHYRVTGSGVRWLGEHFDIDVAQLEAARRVTARPCLDWTERTPHIAGGLGAELLRCMRRRRWLVPAQPARALRVTDRGRAALHALGVQGIG